LILVSILDSSLGPALLANVFDDVVKCTMRKSKTGSEAVQAYTMLVEVIDPFFLWKTLFVKVYNCSNDGEDNTENFRFVEFVVEHLTNPDDETEKIHLPYFYFLLAERLRTNYKSSDFIKLVQRVCGKLQDGVFVGCWNLKDFRKVRIEQMKSPTSALTDEFSRQSSAANIAVSARDSSMPGSPIKKVSTTEWLPNVEDIYRMYNIKSGNSTENDLFLSRFRIGSTSVSGALSFIKRFLEYLVETYINFAASNVVDSLCATCRIMKRHLDVKHDGSEIESALATLKKAAFISPHFKVFNLSVQILLLLPNALGDCEYELITKVLLIYLSFGIT
jgi:hypothetical protein